MKQTKPIYKTQGNYGLFDSEEKLPRWVSLETIGEIEQSNWFRDVSRNIRGRFVERKADTNWSQTLWLCNDVLNSRAPAHVSSQWWADLIPDT